MKILLLFIFSVTALAESRWVWFNDRFGCVNFPEANEPSQPDFKTKAECEAWVEKNKPSVGGVGETKTKASPPGDNADHRLLDDTAKKAFLGVLFFSFLSLLFLLSTVAWFIYRVLGSTAKVRVRSILSLPAGWLVLASEFLFLLLIAPFAILATIIMWMEDRWRRP